MYVDGVNKFQAELDSAKKIPGNNRRLINKTYLNPLD